LLARLNAFLSATDRDPGLVRILVERRDLVERALRSRALPGRTDDAAAGETPIT
jgi:hypothetical protein